MGLLDDALELQESKRSRRLSQAARKAKIDSHKIKEGTYRGIDLTDGTARVQLDDQPTATSGYRLITNAPLGNGDRVSIRPNGVGLPRADARNVAPLVEAAAVDVFEQNAYFQLVEILAFSGNESVGELKSSFFIDIFDDNNPLITYFYENKSLKKVINNNIAANVSGFGSINNIDPALCTAIATSNRQNLSIAVTLNAPFIPLPPIDPYAVLVTYQVRFPIKEWEDQFTIIEFDEFGEASYPWNDSPIEIEALGGVAGSPLRFGDNVGAQILFSKSATDYFMSADPITASIEPFPTGATNYNFSFRYRRRGAANWFQL